jgi:hypothetical protein
VARLPRLFIREVNAAILGVIAAVVVAFGGHYVSTLRELHRMRQELCAARLEALAGRHPYLATAGLSADKCEALTVLTGDPPTPPPPGRHRL